MIKKGTPLLTAILKKAEAKGVKFQDACKDMGISPTFMSEVFSDKTARSIESLDYKAFRHISEYLEMPLAQVYILAELLSPMDFVATQSFDGEFGNVLDMMRKDPVWSPLMPKEKVFSELPVEIKLLIALLYERNVEKSLISKSKIEADPTRKK